MLKSRHLAAVLSPGLLQVRGRDIRKDLLAGLTNAAVSVPQGVAFAIIAGMPPEYGLYTSMIAAGVAALFGSSTVMVSGATTALSALIFSAMSGLSRPGSPEYISLVLFMTLLVGLFQCAAGLAKLGRLVSFVSHSVLVGFTAVAAVLIGISQLGGALGIEVAPGGTVIDRGIALSDKIGATNPVAVLVSAVTLATLILCTRLGPKVPGFAIALTVGSGLAWAVGGPAAGIRTIDPLLAPLPVFTFPDISQSSLSSVAPGAAAIALLGLLEAITIGRSFAMRRHEPFDANREIMGQGLSNIVGGLFQCYASSGSFTRSGVNAEAGARSPLAAIFASLFLGLILIFLSDYIILIPYPVIAGLILFVSWRLIQFAEIHHILDSSRSETTILSVTVASGLLISLESAIYTGVIASFAVFLWQSTRPDIVVIVPVTTASGGRKFRDARRNNLPECPQLVTIRLDGPLYFGSVEHVEAALRRVERDHVVPPDIILVLKGNGSLDLSGADMLIREIRLARSQGRSFRIVAIYPPLIRSLERYHVLKALGPDRLHHSKGDAVEASMKDMIPHICALCRNRVFTECSNMVSWERVSSLSARARSGMGRSGSGTEGAAGKRRTSSCLSDNTSASDQPSPR